MAYESPISVWWSDTKIEQLRDEYDNVIVKAVKNCYPQVDKDELIKALRYDREQYEKGYRDGRLYQPPALTNADRIRHSTDEELAEKIGESIDCEVCKTMHHAESGECPCRPHPSCVDFWLDWLRQEAES